MNRSYVIFFFLFYLSIKYDRFTQAFQISIC